MTRKNNYEDLANSVLTLVGGKENITFFTHCITRLRFNIKDKSLVDLEKIEHVDKVIGCQWSNEQLQIIIGQSVGDAYDQICEISGLAKEKAINENLDGQKKKLGFRLLIESITGCMTPLLPLLIGIGMLNIVTLLLNMTGLLSVKSSTYIILDFVSNAGFYFLPVFIGMTAAKKFGGNPGLGMLIGAMLLHPTFIASVAAKTPLDFLGIPVYATSYSSTIFPVIMSVYVMSKIEKFISKHTPDMIRSLTVPLGTMLIMIPLTFCLIAPAGAFIGTYFAQIIQWINKTVGPLAIAILAAVFPFLVLTGMHTALTPYGLQSYASLGFMPNAICTLISNFNQGAASAAVAVKTKNKTLRATAISCAFTAGIGGITEPAMFGINLKYKTPMIGVVVGGFCGGLCAGLLKVYAYAFGGTRGIFSFPAYMGAKGMPNVIAAIVACAVGIIVTFVVTLILYKEDVIKDDKSEVL